MVHTEGSEESMKKDGALGMEINCVSNMIRRSIDQRIATMPGEKLSRMDSWIISRRMCFRRMWNELLQ